MSVKTSLALLTAGLMGKTGRSAKQEAAGDGDG